MIHMYSLLQYDVEKTLYIYIIYLHIFIFYIPIFFICILYYIMRVNIDFFVIEHGLKEKNTQFFHMHGE